VGDSSSDPQGETIGIIVIAVAGIGGGVVVMLSKFGRGVLVLAAEPSLLGAAEPFYFWVRGSSEMRSRLGGVERKENPESWGRRPSPGPRRLPVRQVSLPQTRRTSSSRCRPSAQGCARGLCGGIGRRAVCSQVATGLDMIATTADSRSATATAGCPRCGRTPAGV
jgi:hypothetical protein